MKKLLLLSLLVTGILFPYPSYANVDVDIVTRIINEFNTQSESWYTVIRAFSLNLFMVVATFEIAYLGVKVSLESSEIKETIKNFCFMLLSSGFFMACINNYKEWSAALVNGLGNLAGELGTFATMSSNPFLVGLELIKIINIRIDGLDWDEMGLAIAMYLASFIILICFALITSKIIVIKCEAIIAMMASIVLLPLGASSLFREYAINAIRYILSVAFKLFVLQLVLNVGTSFIEKFKSINADMTEISIVLGFAVVLLAICNTLPDTVGGIINGSNVNSGSGIKGALSMGGAMLGGAVGGAIGSGMGIRHASQIARMSGSKGFGGMVKGTVKAMAAARHQSKVRRTSMGTELRDRLNTLNDLKGG